MFRCYRSVAAGSRRVAVSVAGLSNGMRDAQNVHGCNRSRTEAVTGTYVSGFIPTHLAAL